MKRALVIVDVQNDFCEGGSLAVPGSREIFPFINKLKKSKNFFSHIVLTRDWHPSQHVSFASTHKQRPFTSIEVNGKVQELWPDHCIADTWGAELSPHLEVDSADLIINKGTTVDVDSYSGFEWDSKNKKLKNPLQNLDIQQVYVCGLAFDYCVGATALDAKKLGYKTFVVEEASKSVSAQTEKLMRKRLQESKIKIISFNQIKVQA